MMLEENLWKRCGTCKKAIDFTSSYYACCVSSCRKSAYCSMSCFDQHTPIFRHKNAWAEERIAPAAEQAVLEDDGSDSATVAIARRADDSSPKEVLVVASKLKDYIRQRSGMNTSANVLARLSDIMRAHSDRAIERAKSEGRKTVMDKDFVV